MLLPNNVDSGALHIFLKNMTDEEIVIVLENDGIIFTDCKDYKLPNDLEWQSFIATAAPNSLGHSFIKIPRQGDSKCEYQLKVELGGSNMDFAIPGARFEERIFLSSGSAIDPQLLQMRNYSRAPYFLIRQQVGQYSGIYFEVINGSRSTIISTPKSIVCSAKSGNEYTLDFKRHSRFDVVSDTLITVWKANYISEDLNVCDVKFQSGNHFNIPVFSVLSMSRI